MLVVGIGGAAERRGMLLQVGNRVNDMPPRTVALSATRDVTMC